MELTSLKALKLLESRRGKAAFDGWIDHSICVGNCAAKIAKSLSLDEDYAKILGYLHDIGKSVGSVEMHEINGYEFLKSLGYDEKYCNICIVHSFLNNDCNAVAGGLPLDIPFMKNFVKNHNYSIYEKLINICDLMCTKTVMTVDKRLIDLIIRKGAHVNTQYHVSEAYKLKRYFDEILGFNIYDLFPEIKNNL